MSNGAGELLVAALLIAQAPQLPKPTFETGIDLISVDVHVVDKHGKPIADLRPDDFEVDISGRRRKIASAQFISYAAAGSKSAPAVGPTPSPATTDSTTPRARRMFVLAVDEHSLHTDNAMAAVKAAERFIDRLDRKSVV